MMLHIHITVILLCHRNVGIRMRWYKKWHVSNSQSNHVSTIKLRLRIWLQIWHTKDFQFQDGDVDLFVGCIVGAFQLEAYRNSMREIWYLTSWKGGEGGLPHTDNTTTDRWRSNNWINDLGVRKNFLLKQSNTSTNILSLFIMEDISIIYINLYLIIIVNAGNK